jgi:EmrB/QacA subfamily drug resistance transporter
MSSSIVVALPSIDREFAMSTALLNWVPTSFLLASAIFVVPFGRAADILGRKRVYLFGISLFTLASVLCGLSLSSPMLVALRVIQGIGAAAIFGTSVAILTAAYSPGERGKALGINVAVTYLGLSLGPFLGGFLTEHLGWRSIFFVNVPLGLAVIILTLARIKQEWAEAVDEKFDYVGFLVYGTGLFCLMAGLSFIRSEWLGPFLLSTGIAAMAAFSFMEARVENPVINMNLLKNNRILVFSILAALINYCATYAVTYLLSLYLQYIKGFGPQYAGLILVAQPAVQAVFSPLAGRMSDRLEPQKVASMGMALTTLGLAVLVFVNNNTSVLFLVAALLVLGLGYALFVSPNTNAVMGSVDKKYYGVTSGLIGTARLVGQTFSMGITSLIFSIYIGNAQIAREYHPHFIESIRMIFIILTVLSFLGIFFSLARGKLREEG